MRITVTTTPAALFTGPDLSETAGGPTDDYRSWGFVGRNAANTGTIIVMPAETAAGAPEDIETDGFRWDLSSAWITYTCEPGQTLYACTASGTVEVDTLRGGER